MTKNDMIASMFEGIIEKISDLDKKLDAVNSSNVKTVTPEQVKEKKQTDESIFITLKRLINSSVSLSMNKSLERFHDITEQMNKTSTDQVQNLQGSINTLINLSRRKRLQSIKIFVIQPVLAMSILFNLYMIKENQRLKDSELQLRYLKVTNNVNQELTGRLDTIFNIYRNEEAINKMRQMVGRE